MVLKLWKILRIAIKRERCCNFTKKLVHLKCTPIRETCNGLKNTLREVRREYGCKPCNSANVKRKPETLLGQLTNIFKQYWFVSLPVHVVNSIVWFAGCYYVTENCFNLMQYLQNLKVREEIIEIIINSTVGSLAPALALYKLMTPFRYGTTYFVSITAIKYLESVGYLRKTGNPFKRRRR